jgi:hypothetical protein
MEELIHFYPVEIVSQVWFMDGPKKCRDVEILSIVLIPRGSLGQWVMSEVPFPEIFLQ